MVRRSYGHILREALHKPENYGKLSIKEGKNGEGERGEGNREMEKIQKRNIRNKPRIKPLKLNQRFFRKHDFSLDNISKRVYLLEVYGTGRGNTGAFV